MINHSMLNFLQITFSEFVKSGLGNAWQNIAQIYLITLWLVG